eukprot:maker-scaffold_1-snap-gene-18.38-mRNA-1 protein AED:0.01 eAED:0.01 QI:83/1/1/1/1/1/3/133/297
MKLIFLDIDGVLNTTFDHKKMTGSNFWVQSRLVDTLCDIMIATGAKIVLSSTWRFSHEMTEYVKQQISAGLSRKEYPNCDPEDFFVATTPDMCNRNIDPQPLPETWHQTRTDEILVWLRENVEFETRSLTSSHDLEVAIRGEVASESWVLDEKISSIESFVCLDDMNLAYYSCYRLKSKIKDHLVLTKTSTGLTKSHKDLAIKILNREWNFEDWARLTYLPCDKPNCFHLKEKMAEEALLEKSGSGLYTGAQSRAYLKGKAASAVAPVRVSVRTLLREKKQRKRKSEQVSSGYEFVL